MVDYVKFTLDDGSAVFFESADSSLVGLRGGEPDVADGGRLRARLEEVSVAAAQVAGALRSRLAPSEVELSFGLKVAGEVNWWFFAKSQAEGTITVTLRWAASDTGDQPA